MTLGLWYHCYNLILQPYYEGVVEDSLFLSGFIFELCRGPVSHHIKIDLMRLCFTDGEEDIKHAINVLKTDLKEPFLLSSGNFLLPVTALESIFLC